MISVSEYQLRQSLAKDSGILMLAPVQPREVAHPAQRLEKDASSKLLELLWAHNNKNPKRLQAAAHTLKEIAASLSARPAYETSLRLELLGRSGIWQDVDELIERLQLQVGMLLVENGTF